MYAELDDIYSKFINPQVRVQYVTEGSTTDCLCNMAGKQTLSGGSHAFVFHNGTISVTVDEQDNVTVADAGSSGGGGVFLVGSHPTIESALDKTWNEINTAMGEGKNVYFVEVVGDYTNYYAINSAYYAADAFSVEGGNDVWVSQTADGYPVIP